MTIPVVSGEAPRKGQAGLDTGAPQALRELIAPATPERACRYIQGPKWTSCECPAPMDSTWCWHVFPGLALSLYFELFQSSVPL